jgi:hypothetical protein
MPLSTPVAFIIFRRPEVTAKVFEQIRLAQPKQLFVIADGPRNEEEALRCQQARAITEKIDWDCEVYRDYSEINLGCRRRVSSGLNWVFEQVEEAIILEDDCLPSQSFFTFCEELLVYYRTDTRIWVISGNNFQDGKHRGNGSYYFSRYNHVWGWATWRRAWQEYDAELKTWPKFRDLGLLNNVLEDSREVSYWSSILDSFFTEKRIDTWDCQWTYTCWANSGLTVLPNVNLVSNIGFGPDSTNTTADSIKGISALPVKNIEDIKHPTFLVRDVIADRYTFKKMFYVPPQKGVRKLITNVRIILGRFKRTILKLYKGAHREHL